MFRLGLRRSFASAATRRSIPLTRPSPLDGVRNNIYERINGPLETERLANLQEQAKAAGKQQENEDGNEDGNYFRFKKTSEAGDEEHDPSRTPKVAPSSPNFYTTRPVFYDQVAQLERAIGMASVALKRAQLLPLPAFARASLPPIHPLWKNQEDMASDFKAKMTLVRYRKVTKLLNELNNLHRIADTAGVTDIAQKIFAITSLFESSSKEAYLARFKKKPPVLDAYGRSYTFGRRKTSSARVWMIPVQQPPPSSSSSPFSPTPLPTTTILVNNLPIHEHFALPADREKITRPLRVAGVLGKYNVFSIVRGGGTTGQSGALAHAISKSLVAHEQDLETLFRKVKLTRRDPRMVERKKTGMAKARKRYTWVKR